MHHSGLIKVTLAIFIIAKTKIGINPTERKKIGLCARPNRIDILLLHPLSLSQERDHE